MEPADNTSRTYHVSLPPLTAVRREFAVSLTSRLLLTAMPAGAAASLALHQVVDGPWPTVAFALLAATITWLVTIVALQRAHDISIGPSGVDVRHGDSESHLDWTEVTAITPFGRSWLMLRLRAGGLLVPTSTANELASEIEHWQRESAARPARTTALAAPAGNGPLYEADGVFDARARSLQRRAIWRRKRGTMIAYAALALLNVAATLRYGPDTAFPIIAVIATLVTCWNAYVLLSGDGRRMRSRIGEPSRSWIRIADDGVHAASAGGTAHHLDWSQLRSFTVADTWIAMHPPYDEPIIVLPDDALVEGMRPEVEQLLRANLRER